MANLNSQRRNRARVAAKLSAAKLQQQQQQQAEQQAAEHKNEHAEQTEQQQQQPSTPASPQLKAESTPIEIEQQPEIAPQPAAEAAEPEAALSAEDQKWATLLRTVSDRLGQIEFELPTLRAQIANHTARVCLAQLKQRAHKGAPAASAASDLSKLHLAHKAIKYSAGMLDENSMQAIFKLDSIQTDNATIRAQRKATVKRGNAIIQESVQLRAKLARWDRFLPVVPSEQTKQQPEVPASKPKQEDVQMKSEAPAAAAAAPSTPAAEEAAMMEDEESVSEDEMEQKYAEPTPAKKQQQQAARPATAQPRAAAPAPAAAAAAPALHPLQKKYAHLSLPTYAGPTFHSRMHPSGALLIEADLSGFQSDDVSVSADPATRVLTIRGVKLPQRRSLPAHSPFGGFFGFAAPMPVEPHGYFTKTVAFEDLDAGRRLNLGALSATINAQGKLEISIPRAAPVQQPKVAPRRVPVSHYTGFEQADDDEDDEQPSAYSHPYAPYYQRAAPRRVAYQPSPFFGNRGWW